MSIYAAPIFGGLGFGTYAVKVDAPPDATAPAKPDEPLERPDGWHGFSAATMGLPGFGKAPAGCDSVYWQMRKYSAFVLAYAIAAGPVLAGTRKLEILKDDDTPATREDQQPNVSGVGPKVTTPEDRIKADMERHFAPLWPEILNGLECLNFGRWVQEVRWEREGGLTLPAEFRDFLPGQAGILYDKFGDFAGIRYQNQDRAPQYVLHHVHQPHLDRLNGWPRLENGRDQWWDNNGTGDALRRAENKAAGISLLISFDREYKFKDNAGNVVKAADVGQTVLNALSTGGTALVPRYSFDKKTLEAKPDLAKEKPVMAEGFDWGSTAPAILACLSVLDARDKRMMRAYGRPEREAMEGQHGTKAEAGVQGDIGTLDSERIHAERVNQFNKQTWRTTLQTNFPPQVQKRLRCWTPTPLADDKIEFKRKAVLAMLSAPGDPLRLHVDDPQTLDDVGIPRNKSVVVPPMPAMPTEPTPPENGDGGTNGTPVNGNGNPDRMRRLGLSAGWDDTDGDGDGYELALNCGTGNGGFQPGNRCSRGGHEFVVSRVDRKGMVHGLPVKENDPSLPPVKLGHVSEFAAVADAPTALSAAPLPEFAAKVKALANNLDTGFGDNKVLIAHAYEVAHEADPSLTPAVFKEKLRQANHEGLIQLSRNDMGTATVPEHLDAASAVNLNLSQSATDTGRVGVSNEAHFILVRSRERRQLRLSAMNEPARATLNIPPINVTLPELNPTIVVNVPEQPAQPAPVVNVNVPEAAAPVVNVAAPTVNVAAPAITVKPEITVQPAEVHLPPREITFQRDKAGKATGATVKDAD